MDKAWKAFERRVAKFFNALRVPVTGRQRGSAPDIEHDVYAIECKYRKTLPEWQKDAMRQAEASVRGEQIPIVVMGEKGAKTGDAFVMIRLGVFREWFI